MYATYKMCIVVLVQKLDKYLPMMHFPRVLSILWPDQISNIFARPKYAPVIRFCGSECVCCAAISNYYCSAICVGPYLEMQFSTFLRIQFNIAIKARARTLRER
jgi:hypothetical protein